ncbi:GGDEF domain-containing protein [uncultured Microbulbifer sp.]|uniref:GGDEF domain-containing protein n=1 Tax=uncultured Microbulbifer sp. TaxID=348147 RepID=UPI0025EA0361|nr:GGDEF domain-containing protein [uncultured Microbulbifer sp.]
MHYPEPVDTATKFALSALQRMKKLGIAANPRNYAIWYEYYAGKNNDLKKSVDTVLSTKKAFDDQSSAEIYERYIAAGADTGRDGGFSERIDAIATHIVEALSTTQENAEGYGEALQSFSGGLENAKSVDHVRELVRDIMERTDSMDAQSKELSRRVQDSAREISELRKALEDSRRDALTDGLTGIPNRKCFDQTLYDSMAKATAKGKPLSLILADLDHFKSFNDNYGHQLGDQVLRLIAKTLEDGLGDLGMVSRYGGEEFAIVLPEANTDSAVDVAQTLLNKVASKRIVTKRSDEGMGTVTMSFGVTTFAPGEDLSDFLERADRALYAAKDGGRNQVVCAGTPAERAATGT